MWCLIVVDGPRGVSVFHILRRVPRRDEHCVAVIFRLSFTRAVIIPRFSFHCTVHLSSLYDNQLASLPTGLFDGLYAMHSV